MVRPRHFDIESLSGLRLRLAKFTEHTVFVRFIAVCIVLNAITLGLETSKTIMSVAGDVLITLDHIFIGIFTIEIFLKLVAYRFAFFRAGWNVFDFIIVVVSLIPSAGGFSVLRSFRIFRVLRLMSVVPSMRRVVDGLLHAMPGMTSIVGVLLIVFYVGAVLTTKLFGQHDDALMQELFGTIGASMYTLFQLMTLEGWSEGVATPTMKLFPWAWAFFIPFIIVTSFAVLNLFIGIIVDAMQITQHNDLDEESDEIKEHASQETALIIKEIQALQNKIETLEKKIK